MSDAIGRLKRWRDVGDDPDPGYCAGNTAFGKDVVLLLEKMERLESTLTQQMRTITSLEAEARQSAAAREAQHREIGRLRAALTEVMEWIDGWDPNFIHDNEWPSTRDKAITAIGREP